MDWQAIGLSLRLSACTTLVLVVLGLPLAYWLANTRWRGKFFIEAIVALPIVLPPTVLGFYVLMAIGPLSPLGRFYESLFGHRLPFTFQGLLVASVLYSLPFAVQPFISGFAAVDRRLVEASWCIGVSKFATFFRVALPLAWPGVLAGMVLSFAHTVGEFGVVLMIGGNIPGQTRTVSVSIYDEVQALNYAAANQT
jgi:molybdate transport system permease protein